MSFSYFGSLLLSSVLFLISLFLIVQVPLFSMVETRVSRGRSSRARNAAKPVRVVEETPTSRGERRRERRRKSGKEKKAVQESFDFLKEIGPYKLPRSRSSTP